MDFFGFLSGLLSNNNIIFIIVGLIVILALLYASSDSKSSPPKEEKKCDVCSDKEVIIFFKENSRDVREKADFCRNADVNFTKIKQAGNKLSAYFFIPSVIIAAGRHPLSPL